MGEPVPPVEKPQRTTLLASFNHAFNGIIHVFRHQRNLKIHFGIALGVLIASLFLNLSRLELIAVFISITFVLISEMINTAVEEVVDMITSDADPRARVAKDVAAGAVLISAINALVVAYFVFADRAFTRFSSVISAVRRSPAHLTFIALIVSVIIVIVLKATLHRGKPLSGGLPSGHAAVAFAGWMAIVFISAGTRYGVLASVLTLFMAMLTAQSRVESGIHSVLEVVLGAILGMLVSALMFQLWF